MKTLFYIFVSIFLIIGVLFAGLSVYSRKQPELGMIGGQLGACPMTPNCVCSEYSGEVAFVEPLRYSTTATEAWDKLKQAIIETGGIILTEQGGYAHARYETSLMRYVDDVEFRLDQDKQLIHVRSASRVGHSDLGENQKRVNRIRAVFNTIASE